MDTFQTSDSSQSLFTKVRVNSIYRATTSIYLIINGKFIKPAVAESDAHENGNIDLDEDNTLQWKDLGMANSYIGNQLLFITTIYGLPDTLKTNEDAKKFILDNIQIDYWLQQDNSSKYTMNTNDAIVLDMAQTAIVYKKIQIS